MTKHLTAVALFAVVAIYATPAQAAPATANYTYDERGQLVRVDYSDGAWIEYAYDEIGNRRDHTYFAPTTPDPETGCGLGKGLDHSQGKGYGLAKGNGVGVACNN